MREDPPMTQHEAIVPGKAAVITGAASGIGLAAAQRFAALGMRVMMADIDAAALEMARAGVAALAESADDVSALRVDVADRASVDALRDAAFARFGDDVAIVMNNAGREGGGELF